MMKLPAMGKMVTITSARVMWRKMVLLLFLPRLSLPSIRLYSTRRLPIIEKMINPGKSQKSQPDFEVKSVFTTIFFNIFFNINTCHCEVEKKASIW